MIKLFDGNVECVSIFVRGIVLQTYSRVQNNRRGWNNRRGVGNCNNY